MKKSELASCAMAVAVVGSLAFPASAYDTRKWNYRDGVGASAANMAAWSEPGNWLTDVADGVDDFADFSTNGVVYAGTRFVRMPDSLTLHSLTGYSGAVDDFLSPATRLVLVGGTLELAASSTAGLRHAQMFADVLNPNNSYLQNVAVCGTFDLDHRLTCSGYTYQHRTDLYAKDTSSVRANFTTTNEVYTGGDSNFRVFAPVTTRSAQTGTWRCSDGSAIIVRTAGDAHPITAGTTLHGAGIPDGAFVRRVFSNAVVEMSTPATADAEGVVTFDAFAPSLCHRIHKYIRAGVKVGDDVTVFKSAAADPARLEFDVVTPISTAGWFAFTFGENVAGWQQGTIVLHDAVNGDVLNIGFNNCNLEFGEAFGDGFSKVTFFSRSKYAAARLTVTNGISAAIGCLSNFVGAVTKDGAGALSAGILASSSGSLSVEGGVMALVSEADASIASVSISSGATLKLPAGVLSATAFSFGEGAVVEGPGVLAVPAGTDISGLVLRGGATVRFSGASSTRLNLARPTPGVPGTPAFWVDATATNSITFDEVGGFVRRLDDVRGTGRMFATNAAASARGPAMMTQNGQYHNLKFTYNNSDTSIAQTDALVWDRPIMGIRAVFKVLDCIDGGGQFLGSTLRVKVGTNDGDFMRPAGWGWSDALVINRNALSANVRNGEFVMNGKPRAFTAGYLYQGGAGSKNVPQLVECHPAGTGATADCFGYTFGGSGRNGAERLCECIVYTNSLTEAERLQVREYLMRKWLGTEADVSVVPKGAQQSFDATEDSGIDVASGESLALGEVSGDGTFVKTGGGDLELAEYAHPSGAIHVRGGTLKVRSPMQGEALVPPGVLVHVDASRTNMMTFSAASDEKVVRVWYTVEESDVYFGRTSGSTGEYPKLKFNAIGDMPTVDFGPFLKSPAAASNPALRMIAKSGGATAKKGLRTVVTLIGSANGGNSIVGGDDSTSHGYNSGYGVQRGGSYGENSSDPIVISSYGDHPSYLEPNAVRVCTNGVPVVATTTGLSGGYDLVSFAAYDPFGMGAIAMNDYCRWVGGQEVAESFYYERGLSSEAIKGLEAYLRKKWFGVETPGFREAAARSLTVDAGASFEVLGGGSMTVSSLSGGGTVTGDLVVAPGGVFEVAVAPDGSVGTLTVSGSVDISGGGTVLLTGSTKTLGPGEHMLVSCPSISTGTGEWIVTGAALRGGCSYGVAVRDGALLLVVRSAGTLIEFR